MLDGLFGAVGTGIEKVLGLFGPKDKNQEYRRQKEFATNAISWKVADAQRAGIHPLYALGAPTTSYAPQSVGGESSVPDLGGMGQDIGRALDASRTQPERVSAYVQKLQQLNLTGLELDNQLKLANLRKATTAENPPMPGTTRYLMDGQTSSGGGVTDTALRRVAPGEKQNQEPGAITDTGWARTSSGGLAPVPSQDVKQRIEDQFIPEIMWALRNNLMPTFSAEGARRAAPPRSALPAGATGWYFDPYMQEYRPIGGKYGGPESAVGRWSREFWMNHIKGR